MTVSIRTSTVAGKIYTSLGRTYYITTDDIQPKADVAGNGNFQVRAIVAFINGQSCALRPARLPFEERVSDNPVYGMPIVVVLDCPYIIEWGNFGTIEHYVYKEDK